MKSVISSSVDLIDKNVFHFIQDGITLISLFSSPRPKDEKGHLILCEVSLSSTVTDIDENRIHIYTSRQLMELLLRG